MLVVEPAGVSVALRHSSNGGSASVLHQLRDLRVLTQAQPPLPERSELQNRLKKRLVDGSITAYPIELEDLQQVDVLRNRKKLSIGELSVLVFAGKTQQAMLTDDRGAQKLALTHLPADAIQSTPHLVAWLYFCSLLADADVAQVKKELSDLVRTLDPHFDNFYREAQQCRAIAAHGARLQTAQAP